MSMERSYLNIIKANMTNPLQTFSVVKNGKHFLYDEEQDKDSHSHHYYSI